MSERIPKYATICGILILVASVWYQYLFYNNFGIDIFSYVDLSEITVLFFGSIPVLLLTGIVVAGYLLILILFFSKRVEKIRSNDAISQEEQQRSINKNNRFFLWIGMMCVILYFVPLMMPVSKAATKFISSEEYFVFRIFIAFAFFSFGVIPLLVQRLILRK